MIMDTLATFASAVAVNAVAGTALIGSQMDLGTGPGGADADDLYLVIIASTGIITGGGAGTVRFQLASDTTAAIHTDGTAAVHYQTADFVTGASTLPAGTVLACVQLPGGLGTAIPYKRFLGILCVTATTTTTAGAINAFLTPDGHRWAALAIASN